MFDTAFRSKASILALNMPAYDVYVFCDQCGQPHSVHVTLELDDAGLDKTLVRDAFAGRELPPEIVFMLSNKYRCPHTNKFFTSDNIALAALFAKLGTPRGQMS
jgi:hypothetical protein